MMTDEEADDHLSKLVRFRQLFEQRRAELGAQERRANPSLRELKEAEEAYLAVKLVLERMCRQTDQAKIPPHIWEKYS